MAALVTLIVLCRITEPIPFAITVLIPIVALPILQIAPFETITLSYANEAIFLFPGGMFAIAMERSNPHHRFVLHVIILLGSSSSKIILGFMIATYALSMWVSNTVTVLMMIPVALSTTHSFTMPGKEQTKQAKISRKPFYCR